jgi:hypothetical protein
MDCLPHTTLKLYSTYPDVNSRLNDEMNKFSFIHLFIVRTTEHPLADSTHKGNQGRKRK